MFAPFSLFVRFLASSALALCALACAHAEEEKQLLRIHWEPGQIYTQQSTTETTTRVPEHPGKMNMTQTTEMRVSKDKASKGSKRVEVKFASIQGTLEAQGKTMTFDSNKPGEANPALEEALGAALKKPFVLLYDENDRFKEARELGGIASKPGTLTGLVALADARAVAQLFRKSLEMGLPSAAVSPGDTWIADEIMAFPQAGDIHVDMTGKFERWEEREGHRNARIAFDGKLANVASQKRVVGSIEIGEGSTISGVIYFDVERHVVSFGAYTSELKLTALGEVVPMTQRVTSKLISIAPLK